MNDPNRLALHHVPARVADLGFSVEWPHDWVRHSMPDEMPDFARPEAFVPLAVVTATHAAIVLAIAARPAHDDGTLLDWARWHLEQQALEPRMLGTHVVSGVPAVVGEALQASDLGPMVVRLAFLEDGGRLVSLSLSAPEMLADAVRHVWFAALGSFRLESPQGARASTASGEAASPDGAAPARAGSPPHDDATPDAAASAQPPESPATADAADASVADGTAAPWWRRALALEAAGDLAEAEALIHRSVPHLSFALVTAELYERRMRRLKARGDAAGARHAFDQARAFIDFYASQATSGGEGAALSTERDAFTARLVADFER